jgi:hypothetical protein
MAGAYNGNSGTHGSQPTNGKSCLQIAAGAYKWQQLLTDGKKMQPDIGSS